MNGDGVETGYRAALASLVLPVPCAGCGRGRAVLCGACRAALAPGRVTAVRPWAAPPGLPPVRAAAWYAGPLRAVLLAHKERGALPLAAPLGGLLAAAVAALCRPPGPRPAGPGGVVRLVPVPSGRLAVARRGHDPLRRIARAAAARLRASGYRVRVRPLLHHGRAVADQAGLGAAERHANLAGALRARAPRRGEAGPVVLVDDLMTSGASLAEAARAVRAVVGREALLGAAVIAVPPPREPSGEAAR